jgi:hypothetical protein
MTPTIAKIDSPYDDGCLWNESSFVNIPFFDMSGIRKAANLK